jgi:hypothetical protein
VLVLVLMVLMLVLVRHADDATPREDARPNRSTRLNLPPDGDAIT